MGHRQRLDTKELPVLYRPNFRRSSDRKETAGLGELSQLIIHLLTTAFAPVRAERRAFIDGQKTREAVNKTPREKRQDAALCAGRCAANQWPP